MAQVNFIIIEPRCKITLSNANQAVQSQKIATDLKFQIQKAEGRIDVVKTNALISCVVTGHLSRNVRKPTMWILTRSDTNQAVQPLEKARGLKFCIKVVEVLYYPSTKNKGPHQLRGYRKADLRLCFRICKTLVFS